MTTDVIASSETEWVYLCDIDDLPEGEISTAKHPRGMDLAIYNVNGEIFVTSDRCTHGAASFYDEGELNGYVVECAWHNGTFDVRTGEALTMPCRTPLPRFDAQVNNGQLFVSAKPNRFKKS